MKSYRVLAAMGFMLKGQPATAWPGSVIELDDNQAKPLVEGGVLIECVPGDTGTVMDGVVTEVEPDAPASRPKGKAE
jgi:hypothetical protein